MPNPTNNKLVDSKTIAALFDMTPRRVQQLTKDGVIAAVKEATPTAMTCCRRSRGTSDT